MEAYKADVAVKRKEKERREELRASEKMPPKKKRSSVKVDGITTDTRMEKADAETTGEDVYSYEKAEDIKPFDEKYFAGIAKLYYGIVFIEVGVKMGGISEWLESFVRSSPETSFLKTAILAFPDRFVANGNREQILDEAGLSSEKIVNAAKELMRI